MNTITRVLVLATVLFAVLTAMVGWSIGTAVSALLTAVILVIVRDGITSQSRLASMLIVAWLYWGLSYVSNLVEAVYFSVIPLRAAGISAAVGLFVALAVAALLELLTAHHAAPSEPQTTLAPGVAWRIPLLAFAFFAIYLSAGAAIHPWIASFYAHMHLPTLKQLLLLQLCRGAFDLACIYPVLVHWRTSRRRALGMSMYVFTVLCGWAPLLLPNQFLPGPIRLAHAIEMGASGIVFGALTAFVLLRSRPSLATNTIVDLQSVKASV